MALGHFQTRKFEKVGKMKVTTFTNFLFSLKAHDLEKDILAWLKGNAFQIFAKLKEDVSIKGVFYKFYKFAFDRNVALELIELAEGQGIISYIDAYTKE
jgi:hypothetical protein